MNGFSQFFFKELLCITFIMPSTNEYCVKFCLNAFVLLNVGVVGVVPVHHAGVAPLLALAAVS